MNLEGEENYIKYLILQLLLHVFSVLLEPIFEGQLFIKE